MSVYTLTHRWFDEVWHKWNENALDELLDEDAVIHGLNTPTGLAGPADFKPFYRNFRESFPSIHVDIEPLVITEESEATHCTVTGEM